MDFLIKLGLTLDGVRPDIIAKLEAIAPDLDHLSLVLRAEMPRVNRIAPVLIEAFREAVLHKYAPPAPAPKAPAPKRFF